MGGGFRGERMGDAKESARRREVVVVMGANS